MTKSQSYQVITSMYSCFISFSQCGKIKGRIAILTKNPFREKCRNLRVSSKAIHLQMKCVRYNPSILTKDSITQISLLIFIYRVIDDYLFLQVKNIDGQSILSSKYHASFCYYKYNMSHNICYSQ